MASYDPPFEPLLAPEDEVVDVDAAAIGAAVDEALRATPLVVSIGASEVNIDLDASAIGGAVDEALRETALPVSGPVTDTELRATALPVSGPVTDTQLRAAAVPVSGPVTDTELRATALPVSGPVTDTQLRATALPVSGPVTDTQLRATALPVSGPVTDTQLRAMALPVSGPVTDTQLRATAVPVAVSPAAYGARVPVTRPNDGNVYAIGDCVGAVLTFPVGPAAGGEVLINSVLLEIDVAVIPAGMTTFDLKFYNVTPPSALADNAVWDIPSGDRTAYLDSLTFDNVVDIGSTLLARYSGPPIQLSLLSNNLFAYLVTNSAYTPTAQTVKVVNLHTIRL